MHEWENEDQMMLVLSLVLESEAVPTRTRLGIDRLLRDLRDGAANDQTNLLEGGDVRHGTLNRLVLQNQQTRALPEWQQGSGCRSSNG